MIFSSFEEQKWLTTTKHDAREGSEVGRQIYVVQTVLNNLSNVKTHSLIFLLIILYISSINLYPPVSGKKC